MQVEYMPRENNLPDWIIDEAASVGTSERLAFDPDGTTRPTKQPTSATTMNLRRDTDIEYHVSREFPHVQGGI
jgi:hypothetical protein